MYFILHPNIIISAAQKTQQVTAEQTSAVW